MAIIGQAAMTRVIVVEADPLIALSGPSSRGVNRA
jgi:hypothetical protein